MAYEVKLIKGRPDTGPIGRRLEAVKGKLQELSTETARAVLVTLPPGELIDAVANHFSVDEINQLAFDMGLEPENLTGERRIDRAHALVAAMHRQRRLPELGEVLQEQRPNVEWPVIPER